MKKILVIAFSLFTVIDSVEAQKGNNQIGVAAEMGVPTGHFNNDFNTGFGGTLKGLWGIGKSAQLTFTTGYTYFKSKGELSIFKAKSSIIPFLAGYRLIKNGFYLEPQIGYGLYKLKIEGYPGNASETDGAFTYAAGIGFTKNGIEAGVRYQGGKKGSDDISLISIHIGYNFSFKGK